jgi:hypothetical protein
MVPHRRQRLAPREPPMARLVAERAPTARQRGELGCHRCAVAPGVVPAPFPCSRDQPGGRSDAIILPAGPSDRVMRRLQGSCSGLPWRVMGRLDTLERRERRLDSRGLEGLQDGRRHGLRDTQAADRPAARCATAPVAFAAVDAAGHGHLRSPSWSRYAQRRGRQQSTAWSASGASDAHWAVAIGGRDPLSQGDPRATAAAHRGTTAWAAGHSRGRATSSTPRPALVAPDGRQSLQGDGPRYAQSPPALPTCPRRGGFFVRRPPAPAAASSPTHRRPSSPACRGLSGR